MESNSELLTSQLGRFDESNFLEPEYVNYGGSDGNVSTTLRKSDRIDSSSHQIA